MNGLMSFLPTKKKLIANKLQSRAKLTIYSIRLATYANHCAKFKIFWIVAIMIQDLILRSFNENPHPHTLRLWAPNLEPLHTQSAVFASAYDVNTAVFALHQIKIVVVWQTMINRKIRNFLLLIVNYFANRILLNNNFVLFLLRQRSVAYSSVGLRKSLKN